MTDRMGTSDTRTSVVLNLEFSRGRHGAAARLEVHERPSGRVGVVSLRGWVDGVAARGIERMLQDLAERNLARLVVDCSQLLHVDYRLMPRLADALVKAEAHAGTVVLCGLSRYLRDLFRIAGCESRFCCWPSASDLLDATTLAATPSERAS
jgi:anti-anti-sigma factor